MASLLAIVAVSSWQYAEHQEQQAERLHDHQHHGQVLLAACDGVAARECRGGRYDPVSLDKSLQDVLEVFELDWLSLSNDDGTWSASAGHLPPDGDKLYRFEKAFEPLRPIHVGRGPGAGQGAGQGAGPGSGPGTSSERTLMPLDATFTLALVTSSTSLKHNLAADRTRFLATTATLILTIALLAGVFWTRNRTFAMAAKLAAGQREVESLEVLRRLGAGLVHETKNPLGVVRGFADRIARQPLQPEQLAEAARAILDETDRTVARLDEFLLFSRPAHLRRETVSVQALYGELAVLLDPDIETAGAELVVACEDAQISADRDQLRRLLINLMLNAIRALSSGGRLVLGCEPQRDGGLTLTVTDDGSGVPEELRHTLFEPYVSGREGGSGLGLAIASRIAIDHGFTLSYRPVDPQGTCMMLEVPAP